MPADTRATPGIFQQHATSSFLVHSQHAPTEPISGRCKVRVTRPKPNTSRPIAYFLDHRCLLPRECAWILPPQETPRTSQPPPSVHWTFSCPRCDPLLCQHPYTCGPWDSNGLEFYETSMRSSSSPHCLEALLKATYRSNKLPQAVLGVSSSSGGMSPISSTRN